MKTEAYSEFRKQHNSLLAFSGVMGLARKRRTDGQKIDWLVKNLKHTASGSSSLENVYFWLSVAYDDETLPFEPFAYEEGGGIFKEDPDVTPMEFVELLDGQFNREEALYVLDELSGHMYVAAYNAFRQVLSRDLTTGFGINKELAYEIMEKLS